MTILFLLLLLFSCKRYDEKYHHNNGIFKINSNISISPDYFSSKYIIIIDIR